LAERHDSLFATAGFHPHEAKDYTPEAERELIKLLAHPKVKAVGEIGLDYYRDRSPRDVQKKVFARQLELAVEHKLPIVIHTRDSFDDSLEMVKRYASRLVGGTFHCFPGNAEEAQRVFDTGLIISVGGVITFKNASMAHMVAEVPLEKVLIETDAPFLSPTPYRGKRNSPEYIPLIVEKLAELHQTTPADVERITDRTCNKLFKLVETFGG
jgi:TatD DNase family protein